MRSVTRLSELNSALSMVFTPSRVASNLFRIYERAAEGSLISPCSFLQISNIAVPFHDGSNSEIQLPEIERLDLRMPSRRFHHKRRHGCNRCKQRRIRCGAERPSCRNCTKSDIRCPFLDDNESDSHLGHATLMNQTSNPPESSMNAEGQFHVANFDDHDAQLMAHYSTTVCFTITDELDRVKVWQTTIPSLALSWPFLRHGLLALSAMHYRLACPVDRQIYFADSARRHLSIALELYIPHVQATSAESCAALFAFATIVPAVCYSFLQAIDTELEGEDLINQFLYIWSYLLGPKAVAQEARQWIHQSEVASLVSFRWLEDIIPNLADEPRTALQTLLVQCQPRYKDPFSEGEDTSPSWQQQETLPERFGHYKHAIEMLSNAFPTSTGQPAQLGVVIGWPVFTSQAFLDLIRSKDAFALAILAHYGKALHAFSSFWWLDGLGRRLIQAVCQILGADHIHLIQWTLDELAVPA